MALAFLAHIFNCKLQPPLWPPSWLHAPGKITCLICESTIGIHYPFTTEIYGNIWKYMEIIQLSIIYQWLIPMISSNTVSKYLMSRISCQLSIQSSDHQDHQVKQEFRAWASLAASAARSSTVSTGWDPTGLKHQRVHKSPVLSSQQR